jgi:large subunit ribosomal protein L15
MGTTLHTLAPNPGANRPKKRLGRGHGSGTHKTSGKGTKGQKARTGHHGIPKPGFEGGQTAMARRLPKRGFHNPFRKQIFAVNLGDIAGRFAGGAPGAVGLQELKDAGLVPRSAKLIKLLGTVHEGQNVPAGLTIAAHYVSASARAHLEKAKGVFQEIAKPQPKKPTRKGKSEAKAQAK